MNKSSFSPIPTPVSELVSSIPQAESIKQNNLVYMLKEKGNDIINLSLGEAVFNIDCSFMANIDYKIANRYGHTRGYGPLCERISSLYRSYKVQVDAGRNVLVTSGSKIGVYLALLALLNPGDEVVIHEPLWVSYPELVKLCRGIPVQAPYTDSFRDLPKHFTEKTRVLIINNPNNPRGHVLKPDEMKDIYEECRRRGIYILADETYAEFTSERKFTSFGALAPKLEGVVIVNSFSKVFSVSGWRLGYIIADSLLIEHLIKLNQHLVTCAPMPQQMAVAHYFDHIWNNVQPQIIEVVGKRREVADLLSEHGVPCLPGDATYYLFANISKFGLSSRDFAELLLTRYGVSVVAGIGYGNSCDQFIRISVGSESFERISLAIDRISDLPSRK
jgi:aspartate/methionine/tyrosine aminotransferase